MKPYTRLLSTAVFYAILIVSLNVTVLNGQAREDFIWLVGYKPNTPDKKFGGAIIDFSETPAIPNYIEIPVFLGEHSILNSSDGTLRVYTDGCRIVGADHQIVANGDSINYGGPWRSNCEELSYPVAQGVLFLPFPESDHKVILFHLRVHDTYTGMDLLYSVIDLNMNAGEGAVIIKDEFILETDITDHITAVKHANGRDWWVVLPETNGNTIYTVLLGPNGVSNEVVQNIGSVWDSDSFCCGQATFSPDGSKYVRYNPWKGIDIFDFDRCTGVFSSPVEIPPLTDPIAGAAGVAFSAGSRFLYASNTTVIYQYDTWAADIESSAVLVAEYDGFMSPFSTNFYQAALTPDHRIFLSSSNTVTTMHVIDQPDLHGLDADVQQHSFELPVHNAWTLPNFPHFRLGPIDGSNCDSLDIDNVPVADFVWTADSLNPASIRFKNTSYFEPVDFNWTFGNGSISSEKNPIHTYTESGVYEVCLTVSNDLGLDTRCSNIDVVMTSALIPFGPTNVRLSPNPFTSEIIISFDAFSMIKMHIEIYNLTGQLMYQQDLPGSNQFYRINLQNLPPGGYYYLIRDDHGKTIRGLIVKVS